MSDKTGSGFLPIPQWDKVPAERLDALLRSGYRQEFERNPAAGGFTVSACRAFDRHERKVEALAPLPIERRTTIVVAELANATERLAIAKEHVLDISGGIAGKLGSGGQLPPRLSVIATCEEAGYAQINMMHERPDGAPHTPPPLPPRRPSRTR